MAITFIAIIIVMVILTKLKPLKVPKKMPVREEFDMRPAASVKWLGAGIIGLTLILYTIFW